MGKPFQLHRKSACLRFNTSATPRFINPPYICIHIFLNYKLSHGHTNKDILYICFLATCLVCYSCEYDSTMPSAQQTCNNSHVETCANSVLTHCGAQVYVKNATTYYKKACMDKVTCSNPSAYCTGKVAVFGYTKCNLNCCQTDKCNDPFPSLSGGGDSGSDHVKIGQTVFAAGLVAAILFA